MTSPSSVCSSVEVLPQNLPKPWLTRLCAIIRRQIETRCPARMVDRGGDCVLHLEVNEELPAESYSVRCIHGSTVVIAGGDPRGLLYGVGKVLRNSTYTPNGFVLGCWEGASAPAKPVRGIYLATHFHNFYHDAPVEAVIEYIEDVALWGFNTVQVWFDMHHYMGIDDPEAQSMIQRLRAIMAGAKAIGLHTCLIGLGNEAYANSPRELHADFNTGRSIYRCELCPSKAGSMQLMLRWYEEVLEAFADVPPDTVGFGPYDQGGCACEQCRPWGANGFLRVCEAKARLARNRFPDVKILLSTWLFDYGGDQWRTDPRGDQGEWRGLTKAFQTGVDWCDYIQADSHETYPEYPLKEGVPGGLPLLNFPEISMWMMYPWGGFGANPLPGRFQGLWNTVKDVLAGGFPYSEGIYEDINKAIYAQFYWSPERPAEDIVREYIAFEYSPAVVDDVLAAICTLEANHNHLWQLDWQLAALARYPFQYRQDPKQAFALIRKADAGMTETARAAWRWRILYLRALVDQELQPTGGCWPNDRCEEAFQELTQIYHAQNAEIKCAPPTWEAVKAMRTSETTVRR